MVFTYGLSQPPFSSFVWPFICSSLLGCDSSYQTIAFPIHPSSDYLDYGPFLTYQNEIINYVSPLFTIFFRLALKKQKIGSTTTLIRAITFVGLIVLHKIFPTF
jgi:hypothetical protein